MCHSEFVRYAPMAEEDFAMLVWWGTTVECISALARLERDGALTVRAMHSSIFRFYPASVNSNTANPPCAPHWPDVRQA